MKKFLLSLSLITAMFTGNAQILLYEGFEYPAGDSLPQHGWTGLNSGDQILVTAGNLDYAGLATSVGNKIAFSDYGRDFQKTFTAQTSGTIYMSYIIQATFLDSLDAVGGYFAGLVAGSSTTNFASTLWAKKNGTGYSLGLNARSSVAYTSWNATALTANTPIFVVVSYEMISGITNDVAKMWINPAPASLGLATSPAADITIINGGTDLASFDKIFLRQDSYKETPGVEFDEIRVGTSWASVTPATTGINEVSDINVMNVYPNPATNMVTIAAKEAISNVSIYDFQGRLVQQYDFNNSTEVKLNVSELSNGIYNIVANSAKGNSFSTKLIK